MNRILAINPGATSTKIAVFDDEQMVIKKTVEHSVEGLQHYNRVFEQFADRLSLILAVLKENDIPLASLDAVVGRGGLLKPLAGGTYAVNERMIEALKKAERGEHASNLGAVIAYDLAHKMNIPAFIVDPVSVDELEPVARVSGLPGLDRISLSHALNMKAVARQTAEKLEKRYEELNLIVAHLGTGISVSAHQNGRMIDVNNARDEGPFSPDRCGSLPATQLVKLCYSDRYTHKEMLDQITKDGGLFAYLGTKDLREAIEMAEAGNQQAALLLEAMPYQIAKEIGALAAVLEGKVDAVILTGGIAYSAFIVERITRRIRFIAPVIVLPGEEELGSLAMGALRVLRGEECAKEYR